jgi:putative alpha-1,2-mannosidase
MLPRHFSMKTERHPSVPEKKSKRCRMKKELTFSLIGLSLLGTTSCSTAHKGCAAGRSSETGHAIQNLVQYAKPMCGTARDANTFPGAVAPFGMTQ